MFELQNSVAIQTRVKQTKYYSLLTSDILKYNIINYISELLSNMYYIILVINTPLLAKI